MFLLNFCVVFPFANFRAAFFAENKEILRFLNRKTRKFYDFYTKKISDFRDFVGDVEGAVPYNGGEGGGRRDTESLWDL